MPFQREDLRSHYFIPRKGSVPTLLSCLIAVLSVAIAYLVQKLVWPLIPASPFLLFYPAIFLSARLGGRKAGVLTSVLSVVVVDYEFLPPFGGFNFRGNGLSELIFVAIGISITVLVSRQREIHEVADYAGSRLRNLVDWLDHAIVWEMDGKSNACTFVSKGTERLLGISIADWYQKPGMFLSLVHPKDRYQVQSALERTLAGENDLSIDHRLVHADGKPVWYHTGIHVDREAEAIKLRCITVDITRLKEIEARERALKEDFERQKRMYDALLDGIKDHVFLIDREERLVYANRAHLDSIRATIKSLGGDPNREILGRTYREFAEDPAFLGHFEPNIKRALRGETVRHETSYFTPKGQRVFEYILSPIYGSDETIEAITGVSRDIQERKKNEEALRESQDRLTLALNAAKFGTFEWDTVNDRHIWDARTEELFGFAPGTFPRTRAAFVSRVHPDDAKQVMLTAENALRNRQQLTNEYRVLLADGKVRWVAVSGKGYYDSSGRPIRLSGVIQDITARKSTESKLNEIAERDDLALKAGRIGVFEMDLLHLEAPVEWSTRQYEIFGLDLSRGPITYEKFQNRVHPEDLPAVNREFEASVHEKRDFRLTYRIVLDDGSLRWIQASARALFDPNGKPARMIGTNIDITETVRAQEEIRESAERFRELAESMPQIVWATDPNGNAYYYNNQWFEFLGAPLAEAGAFEGWSFIHPEDREKVEKRWAEASQSRSLFQTELRMKGRDGDYHWFLSRAQPIFNSEGRLVRWYGTLTNVDESKKVEEIISRALKAREEMLAIVSHDLRNPLGSILMSAAMIKRKSPCDDAFTMEQAQRIQRAGERMNEMIEDLLNLAKMESGNFTLTKRDICGCDVVTEAIELMAPLAQEKKIRIESSGTNQPLQMSCDHNQVLRVFSNLIGNAIKFTPEHGLIRVNAQDRGKDVLFSVSDTGPGIAEHHIHHVFDRFWQAAKTQHMGTGLGLAISKGIVEAHGGRIWVNSRFGHGATFSFTLPKTNTQRREEIA